MSGTDNTINEVFIESTIEIDGKLCNSTFIDNNAFKDKTSITSIVIPKTIEGVGDYAFSGCIGLTSITIPNSVTSIGEDAFSGCTSLTSVNIGNGVTTIGDHLFNGFSKLTNVVLGSGITAIGERAFANIDELTDVTILVDEVPETDRTAFENSYIEDYVTLHVLEESLEKYKAVAPWKNFKNIVAYQGAVAAKYTLTYMVDGEVYQTVEVREGTRITPLEEPTKEGYVFTGWKNLPITMPAENVTVGGSFIPNTNKYTITYKVDGKAYKTYELKYGSTIIPESDPVKEGYEFSGWSEIPEEMPAEDIVITGTFTKILEKLADPTIDIVKGEVVFSHEIDDVTFNYEITLLDNNVGKGNNVRLTQSYKISVYASKEGFKDSEIVTKEISIKKGDLNFDGKVDVADHVELTKIIMSGETQEEGSGTE